MFKYYNVFRRFCAFLVGMVFFLSGLLKLLDPVGAGLVVDEYLKFLHLGFLSAFSLMVGVGMALIETILGTALMVGLWRKVVSIVTFSILGIFTALTLVLLIFNPVMDCGCFGEAIHLTHLQTFIKNIILLALALVAFIPGNLGQPSRLKRKYASFGIVGVLVVAFTVYSLLYIPLVDFTEFRPGARLEACGDGYTSTYTAVFVYEREGEERTFTLNNLPDSTWTYVRTDTVMEEFGDEMMAVLSFSDGDGNYCDELATEGDVLVFSVYNMKRMSGKRWSKLALAVQTAEDAGFTTIILSQRHFELSVMPSVRKTSSATSEEEIQPIVLSSYLSDYKTVLTMNRSNGGATYFHNGTLVRKWARRSLPSYGELTKILESDRAETMVEAAVWRNLVYEGLIVVVFGVLFFV